MVAHLVCNSRLPLPITLYQNSDVSPEEAKLFWFVVPGKAIISVVVASIIKLMHWCTTNDTLWEAHIYRHFTHSVELDSCNGLYVLVEPHDFSADYFWCGWLVCEHHIYVSGGDIIFICVPLFWYTTSTFHLLCHLIPALFCLFFCNPHAFISRIHPISRIIFDNFLTPHKNCITLVHANIYSFN